MSSKPADLPNPSSHDPSALSDYALLEAFKLVAATSDESFNRHHLAAKSSATLFTQPDILLKRIETRLADRNNPRTIGPLGSAKVEQLLDLATELVRRRVVSFGRKIRQAEDVFQIVHHIADRPQEHVLTLSLNGAHELIACRTITVGLVNVCQIHPREVFAQPLVDRAASVIVAHNHPSGELTPSSEDRAITERLKNAGEILGIRLLDHVIFSTGGFYSLAERSEM